MGKLKNIIGNKYGRLTVIKMLDEKGNHGQLKYLCKCDCGKSHIVTGESLRSGKSKSCGCLKKEFIEKNKFKRNMDRENAMLKVQYSHIKRRNTSKGFVDIISFNDFCKLSMMKCYYCDAEYSRVIEDRYCEMKEKGKISDTILKINGLDRVDSSKGYTIDNVVPCCATCNTAKNKMTQKEFKEWIKTVYENYVK